MSFDRMELSLSLDEVRRDLARRRGRSSYRTAVWCYRVGLGLVVVILARRLMGHSMHEGIVGSAIAVARTARRGSLGPVGVGWPVCIGRYDYERVGMGRSSVVR